MLVKLPFEYLFEFLVNYANTSQHQDFPFYFNIPTSHLNTQ